jgi:hypothetical protein
LASATGDGKRLFDLLDDFYDHCEDPYLCRLLFNAMVRIRHLETRVTNLEAECQHLEVRRRGDS